MKKIIVTIEGTHCNACKALIEDVSLTDIPGVLSCNVDFASGKTVVEHDDKFNFDTFKKEIEKLGDYKVKS